MNTGRRRKRSTDTQNDQPKKGDQGTLDGKKIPLQKVVNKIFETIDEIKEDLHLIREPNGTQENPSRTCKDLYLAYPDFKDGYYWIDPNLGVHHDAIEVYCNMTANGETCLSPKKNQRMALPRPYAKDPKDPKKWYSDLQGGFKIRYHPENQVAFIRLMSVRVRQKFTYFCTNALAYDNKNSNHNSMGIRFMGANEDPIKKIRPRDVPYDGCRNRRSNAYTVFDFHTKKIHTLPIIDFMPNDYGGGSQKFGFEIGPVCFS